MDSRVMTYLNSMQNIFRMGGPTHFLESLFWPIMDRWVFFVQILKYNSLFQQNFTNTLHVRFYYKRITSVHVS